MKLKVGTFRTTHLGRLSDLGHRPEEHVLFKIRIMLEMLDALCEHLLHKPDYRLSLQ